MCRTAIERKLRSMPITTPAVEPGTARSSTREPVIEVRDLVKRCGTTDAVRECPSPFGGESSSASSERTGPARTTTVEILQGLRRPTQGLVRVLGLDPQADGDRLRRLIGAQLQAASLPDRMRVEGAPVVRVPAPGPPTDRRARLRMGLVSLRQRQFGGLSG